MGIYLSDELPLSAHEGHAVLHRQVQPPLDGLLQGEVKVKPTEEDAAVLLKKKKKMDSPPLSASLSRFRSPLVELWVEVPLLGGGPPLGGGLLVRQEDKGHVRVGAILGAGRQGSEGVKLRPGTRGCIGTVGSRQEILLKGQEFKLRDNLQE